MKSHILIIILIWFLLHVFSTQLIAQDTLKKYSEFNFRLPDKDTATELIYKEAVEKAIHFLSNDTNPEALILKKEQKKYGSILVVTDGYVLFIPHKMDSFQLSCFDISGFRPPVTSSKYVLSFNKNFHHNAVHLDVTLCTRKSPFRKRKEGRINPEQFVDCNFLMSFGFKYDCARGKFVYDSMQLGGLIYTGNW